MHVQRAIQVADEPATIVCTDVSTLRLGDLQDSYAAEAAEKGIEFICLNPMEKESYAAGMAPFKAAGFDDIIVLQPTSAETVSAIARFIARRGTLNLIGTQPLDGLVSVDLGRLHYDYIAFLGHCGTDIAASYGEARNRAELRPGGATVFIGAGGPMGQMHVQRAIELSNGPRRIIATDLNAERLATLGVMFNALAEANGKELILINPAESKESLRDFVLRHTDGRGADDVVVSVPVASVMAEADPGSLPPVEIDGDDDATIFYTSGTTGNPKGALGSHRNMCSNLISGAFVRMRTEIRYGRVPAPPPGPSGHLLSVPLFHATGCHGILCGNTFAGNMIVTMYNKNPEEAIRLIEREKLASFGGVPSMVWQVIESPEFAKHDLSSVQSIGYGGAPSAPELVKRIGESFPQVKPSNGYGLTETSALTTSNSAEDYLEKPTSAGCPAPVSEVRIAGDDGQEVPRGTIGEVWIKGPQVVKGYWRKPEATAQSFTDGWLHTGDLGYMDGDGFLYIADRAKDMLIRGGENVYCVEVESALYSHPDVMDAAVVGIPHRVLGEEVGALVQIRPGGNPTEEELKKHVASQLAGFKVPVRIDMQRDPLPRNANGKIMKPEVKKLMGLA